MFFQPARFTACLLPALALFLLAPGRLPAAPAGPTLQFDYGTGRPQTNSLSQFMYFVPLISPEQITISTNLGNTQSARVTSFRCRTNDAVFHAVCEFDFIGQGLQRDTFDHSSVVKRREAELKAGKSLAHQLADISVQGAGSGSIEIDGVFTNGQRAVTEMRLRFNGHGHTSPVVINLQDIVLRNGSLYYENETVARVNTLTFRQKSPPKMEVTLASVKRKDAGDSLWQNFVGGLKGTAANFLLPPLNITASGQQSMLDFGLALATQQPTFTFPFANRLTNGPPITP